MTEYKRPLRPLWERVSRINGAAIPGSLDMNTIISHKGYVKYKEDQHLTIEEQANLDSLISTSRDIIKGDDPTINLSNYKSALLKPTIREQLIETAKLEPDDIAYLLSVFLGREVMVKYRLTLRK